jgi:hypothetical protein
VAAGAKQDRTMLWRAVGLLSLASLIAGCGCGSSGPPLYPVRGKVLLNGEPAAGTLVVFHPKSEQEFKHRPSGRVADDGSYVISTFGEGDGAPPGAYTVTLSTSASRTERVGAKKGGLIENRLPKKYGDPKTSPLTATVTAGPTEIPPFEVQKKSNGGP